MLPVSLLPRAPRHAPGLDLWRQPTSRRLAQTGLAALLPAWSALANPDEAAAKKQRQKRRRLRHHHRERAVLRRRHGGVHRLRAGQ
ncbi:MAG: hypothetical protein QM692_11605 [Thermomicrobiales bacterium]